MAGKNYKKYTKNAQSGNKGEAFFESIISDYCIAHKVVGSKDLGIDFICEWVYGEQPTGVIFAVQVKTIKAKPQKIGTDKTLNGLDKFTISNSHLTIDKSTIEYWKGFGIPFYLFAIVPDKNSFNCFYKRFTPILTKENEKQESNYFFKVNRGVKFIAFKNSKKKMQGFARDLYIDFMRWQYCKGSLAYLNPRKIGLKQFPEDEDTIFGDLFKEYKNRICSSYRKIRKFLDNQCKK